MVVDEFGREVPGAAASGGGGGGDHHHYSSRGSNSRDDPAAALARRKSSTRSSTEHRSSPSRAGTGSTKRFRHAVERYMETPMLCQYLWEQEQKQKNSENEKAQDEDESNKKNDDDDETQKQQQAENKEDYDTYRHHYCLKYVRSFFNEHLDDSWFRSRYSPLGRAMAAKLEANRAVQEAQCMLEEIHADPQVFVQQAQLGQGQKSNTSTQRKRKYRTNEQPQPQDEKQDDSNTVPQSHVLDAVKSKTVIMIGQVPPHVTEDQLHHAIMDHCSKDGAKIQVYSSTVTYTASNANRPLCRQAHVVCESSDVRLDILNNLEKANYSASRIPNATTTTTSTTTAGDIPRKDDAKDRPMPKFLDLDVDCSDPYGRFEVDPDGKGGGTAPSEDMEKVPTRRATVSVQTTLETQPVAVLTAALSCTERIDRDKDAAVMLTRALDVARGISQGVRLDDLLDVLHLDSAADILDVSIAYLRRVHLFSFYNGCTRANGVGDVFSNTHSAGVIHLRLKGADELLQQSKRENEEMYGDLDNDGGESEPAKDLLVMRLDDSITKALEQSNEWVAHAGGNVLDDETTDQQAKEIEELEASATDEWVQNHCIIDADGRARCSFHFCRKLFKDKKFLEKHLVKKHPEFLRAEVTKCHDPYMMKSWDSEANRPVPPILVDCGAKFGLVLSNVTGAENPTATDPEPELWRKEEERRKRMEEEEERHHHSYDRDRHHGHRPRGDMDDRGHHRDGDNQAGNNDKHRGSNRGGNFVDVDDVKVEKVELSFDQLEVPVQPPKKKKKRKKLL